ncbi:homoserine dehydrogenase [Rhodoplanes serenus]|jgi:homoserine dehydrogenase|uniref:Homoserine dehydrogenase n=1 Tax=Rhodoplanes serenus TaxID=200615 RepID=A0A327JY76_9BRAD|nr:homoserine dehydrogenase [Rhodoplanes serenus]MBI5112400.1 homoserine dehydrogenase [Rhodovulum sp.]MTW18741.1 homoserine dehydrogenase [Rhodoplanes serenus]RAI30493.1 homoserine dehydrogenase [Rhodoplanes serenus]VCU09256.1 Homoserine dehydrogenase [Rhodoplanes serenus]
MVAPLKVGLAGLGTVGGSVAQLLHRQESNAPESNVLGARCGRPVRLVAVSAKAESEMQALGIPGLRWVASPQALATDPEIDAFVELMGGEGDPAKSAIEAALSSGKPVVTANKALIARHGVALATLAERSGAALNFEAAVGGAIPVVKTLREGFAGNSFDRVYGILNGTCNYILSRMESEKLSFADCLREAQRLGYAEANPTFDVDGHDTAQKIAILASLAFGVQVDPDAVYVEGISSITPEDLAAAAELGYRIKLLGVAVRTESGIEQRVHPTMVRLDSPLAQVMGVTNAVTIDPAGFSPITLVGPGAGGAATASAVVADLADIARGARVRPFARPVADLAGSRRAPMQRHEGGYYIRLLAVDRPGTFATIARHLADEQISLESIVQRRRNGGPHGGDDPDGTQSPAPIILVTYATTEDAVRKALREIKNRGVIAGNPQVIRIEKN